MSMKTMILASMLCVAAGNVWAQDASPAALQAQIDALKTELAKLKGEDAGSLPLSRFDGRWEGEIIGDRRHDCFDGRVWATVRNGALEGTRKFTGSSLAVVQGSVRADGSYEGLQNRIAIAGLFTEQDANLHYVAPDGACSNTIVLRKVGPL